MSWPGTGRLIAMPSAAALGARLLRALQAIVVDSGPNADGPITACEAGRLSDGPDLPGDAVGLMRTSEAEAVVTDLAAGGVPIYACGAGRVRDVTDTDTDIISFGAKFGNPTIFVSLVERAERVIAD